MSSFYRDDCYNPCHEKEIRERECECSEDPSIRSLRRQLSRLEGSTVVIIANNFFSIVTGTVSRVTNGTVLLNDASVFGIDAGRVIIALSKINLVVPVTTGTTATGIMAGLRGAGIFGQANGFAGAGILGQANGLAGAGILGQSSGLAGAGSLGNLAD